MTKQLSTTGISKERLRALPEAAGVYLMKDSKGEVIYVGKAKNLKSRVSSYFGKGDNRYNVQFLLERVNQLETLVTDDERQALVLEADLIKKYRPRDNIRLKDDKAYLIVRIEMNHQWPRLELVRSIKDDGARYIGPFAFSYELRTMLEVIKRSVPLRTCSDRTIYNRVRPCLEYQIKRCAGPCCLDVDSMQYLSWVEQAVHILEGNTEEVVKELEHDMEQASEELRFEDAATVRDRIEVLTRIQEEKQQVQFGNGSMDAFGVYREGQNAEVSVLMVRQGRLFEAKTFGFTEVAIPSDELLGSLLGQYYTAERTTPELILLSWKLEDEETRQELYSERAGAVVQILHPQRGAKARLLALAQRNAKENFEARFSSVDKAERILKGLQAELELEEMPRTVECVDISHFQGGATVGAIVSFQDMKPDKSRYRHFHLSQEGKPDDFASMREVLRRQLSRAAEENTLPDLLVVDGGPAQLAQAVLVRKELGLNMPEMIGLAKKRGRKMPVFALGSSSIKGSIKKPERIFLEGSSVPVILGADNEALYFLERIRDEAHRFAVTFHRSIRSKKVFQSALDSVPGIGPKRRMELLRVFGSVEEIKKAAPEEIAERCGMPLKLAERVVSCLSKK